MGADERFAVARAAARRGGQVAHDRFRTDLDIDRKDGKTDLVTDADRDAQAAAATVLPALGDTYCYGPDGAARNGEPISVSDRTDPETFTVATTVWWPFDRREEYAAATRETVERFGELARYGSAQATLGHVAAGGLDGAFTNVDTHPWDTVAGAALVEAAGGTVTDLEGNRWDHASQGLVASNGACHEALLAAARAVDD